MPELPEVETVKKQLWSEISQKTIKKITLNRSNLRFPIPDHFISILQDTNIENISRHGKYIIIECGNHYDIIIHLGMTGRFVIDQNENYDDQFYFKHDIKADHEHIIFDLSDGKRVSYYDPRRFGYFDLEKEKIVIITDF